MQLFKHVKRAQGLINSQAIFLTIPNMNRIKESFFKSKITEDFHGSNDTFVAKYCLSLGLKALHLNVATWYLKDI